MSEYNDELREVVEDIIALGSDHPNGGFPDGLKSDGTYAPQNETDAMKLIEAYTNTKVVEVLDELYNKGVENGAVTIAMDNGGSLYTHVVPIDAIQAERAKLTQEGGSDE